MREKLHVKTCSRHGRCLLAAMALMAAFTVNAQDLVESLRQNELNRVSYILAALNRDGYSLDNLHEKNWFYDRVRNLNQFYDRSAEVTVLGASPPY